MSVSESSLGERPAYRQRDRYAANVQGVRGNVWQLRKTD